MVLRSLSRKLYFGFETAPRHLQKNFSSGNNHEWETKPGKRTIIHGGLLVDNNRHQPNPALILTIVFCGITSKIKFALLGMKSKNLFNHNCNRKNR